MGVRDRNAEILGHLWPESFVIGDRPVPADDLTRLGWRSTRDGWERRWILHSDLDRTDMKKTVEATIAFLAGLNDEEPRVYPLVYRPPGEESAGLAQVGCALAVLSTLAGNILGVVVTVIQGEPAPVVHIGLLATTIGLIGGFLAFGTLFPRVLALSGAFRGRAAEIGMALMLVVPGVMVLVTWLVALALEPLDGEVFVNLAALLLVAAFVVGYLIPGGLAAWRRARSRR